MLLSCRVLENVSNVNSFDYTTQAEFTQGDAVTVYIQLIDKSKATATSLGQRYVPAAASSLVVVVDSIDDAKKLTRTATQPYDGDGSIWSFSVLATDTIRGTASLRLTLTEGAVITRGSLPKAIAIFAQDAS